MASHSVTIQLRYDMTWADLQAEVRDANVPDTAKPKVHVSKDYGPMDPGYEEITFTWRQ